MKPAWDKLGDAFKGSSSVVVGDVDCTAGGESVCTEQGVSGYPTIKYFTAETGKKGEDYSGGRDFESLEKFTKETLAKKCDVVTKEDCDDKAKAYIDKQGKKDVDKLNAEAKRLEGMKGGDMTDEKRAWVSQRIVILTELAASKSGAKPEKEEM
jgi:protein disulfide-isomerase A6